MRTFYEFFAGGGMARAGLGSGWTCLLSNDISDAKGRAYATNWGEDHLKVKDIYDIEIEELPDRADLAWGSFPCQDLSLAGAGIGLEGERSGAFWGFWNIVRTLRTAARKPRLVVLENVYGALTSHDGKDFELIAKTIAREGYLVGAMVIDAVHFVPQSRPRLFIIAIDKSMAVPDQVHTVAPNPAWHPDALIRAYNCLSPILKKEWRWWSAPPPNKKVATLDELIESEPQGVSWHSEDATAKILSLMTPLHRRKVLAAQSSGNLKVGTIYKRTRLGKQCAEVRFDGIAGCLRTPGGGSSRQTVIVVSGNKIRTRLISPREAARLMGLPETYILPARYNEAYHLLGDGVVVPVVTHLENHILSPVLQANPLAQEVNQRSIRMRSICR